MAATPSSHSGRRLIKKEPPVRVPRHDERKRKLETVVGILSSRTRDDDLPRRPDVRGVRFQRGEGFHSIFRQREECRVVVSYSSGLAHALAREGEERWDEGPTRVSFVRSLRSRSKLFDPDEARRTDVICQTN